jgi:hypothetical protein
MRRADRVQASVTFYKKMAQNSAKFEKDGFQITNV